MDRTDDINKDVVKLYDTLLRCLCWIHSHWAVFIIYKHTLAHCLTLMSAATSLSLAASPIGLIILFNSFCLTVYSCLKKQNPYEYDITSAIHNIY